MVSTDFSHQFKKVVRYFYKRFGYNLNVRRQSACLVINPVTIDNFAALFNCTAVDLDQGRLYDGTDIKLYSSK